jgi:hypothetical protein
MSTIVVKRVELNTRTKSPEQKKMSKWEREIGDGSMVILVADMKICSRAGFVCQTLLMEWFLKNKDKEIIGMRSLVTVTVELSEVESDASKCFVSLACLQNSSAFDEIFVQTTPSLPFPSLPFPSLPVNDWTSYSVDSFSDASLETEEVIDRSIRCHVTVSKKQRKWKHLLNPSFPLGQSVGRF